jgi:hypothetical protein
VLEQDFEECMLNMCEELKKVTRELASLVPKKRKPK